MIHSKKFSAKNKAKKSVLGLREEVRSRCKTMITMTGKFRAFPVKISAWGRCKQVQERPPRLPRLPPPLFTLSVWPSLAWLGETGQRPLICALGAGRFDIVLLLLHSGADFRADDTVPYSFLEAVHRIQTNDGLTISNPERRKEFETIVSWLRENGVVVEDEK